MGSAGSMPHANSAFAAPGLTESEARRRLAAFGPNRLVAVERWAWLREALRIACDPMAVMLACAGAVYLLLGEVKDGVILLAAIVPVLGVDVVLEARSRAALRALAAAVRPRARVRRDGVEREIPSEEIVPGDLLLVREGDVVHADCVVRVAANLDLDEAQLTDESEPVRKRPRGDGGRDGAEEEGSLFAGSVVLAGHGVGEVTRTGRGTRFGRIAELVATSAPELTPLQRRTGRMVRILGSAAVVVALLVLLLGLWRGVAPYPALLTALSVAISAVPEEFPLVFTIFLSMGAFRLSRRGVMVRRLAAVETLGATTVICTDKTGTLTAGQFALDVHVVLEGTSEQELLEAALLACEPDPADTIERAIVAHCREHGLDPATLLARWDLARDHDFDPVGKHMSHVWRRRQAAGDGRPWRIAAKGAFEGVVVHCTARPEELARAEAAHALLAGQGMRVLAVAVRCTAEPGATRSDDERDLRLVGLLGFRDPLRPEVPRAVEECTAAGITVKIVTGDHALTAHAIADAAGIPHTDRGIVSGDELDALPADERVARVQSCAIFARVRPEQKHSIVEALAHAGEVVAMTGDGINDAAALRRADIGVSFGRRGTAVARAAADLVLLDDDFSALVATVREGRAIYANLQRAFVYLLSFKLRVVGLALFPPLVGLPPFFQPVHLVWLELVIHPISALVFEAEPPPTDLMRRPPRPPAAPLVPPRVVVRGLITGLLLTLAAAWAYAAHLGSGVDYARSLGVSVVIAGSLLQVWAERAGDRPLLSVPAPRTLRFWLVWGAVALSLPLFMYVPAIARVFQIAPLRGSDWALVVAVSVAAVAWRAVPALTRTTERR